MIWLCWVNQCIQLIVSLGWTDVNSALLISSLQFNSLAPQYVALLQCLSVKFAFIMIIDDYIYMQHVFEHEIP